MKASGHRLRCWYPMTFRHQMLPTRFATSSMSQKVGKRHTSLQSEGAPGFVRTSLVSDFEPRLATFEEIRHLTNRRGLAVERYEHLYNRSIGRFESLAAREYQHQQNTTGSIGATLCLSLCPQFPTRPLIGEHSLLEIIRSESVAWRNVGFPWRRETITQQESVLVPRP